MLPPLHRLHRLHRLGALDGLDRVLEIPDRVLATLRSSGARPHRLRRRGPSIARLLLAGLAVLTLVRLMTAANRPNRPRVERILVGALLVAVAAFALSLRRSARRHRW